MKALFAMLILFVASSSLAGRDGVNCSLEDKTYDQVKLSIHFKEDYECDMSMGAFELYCKQMPDIDGMDADAIEKLSNDLFITKCIDREEKEVTIKTQNGRVIKTLAQLKLSDRSECKDVQMPKIAGALACSNLQEVIRARFGGNPRIRDTEL
jgi:hypothetical protein